MDNTKHKSCSHQTEGEYHSANVLAVEGTGNYNKELSMFQLPDLCLWNSNKYSENEWKKIQDVQSCH